jgi:hypothetical protein
MTFDFTKRDRPVQRFHGRKINSGPIAFLRSRIGVRGPNYFRDSYHGFVIAAVIEKNLIVLLHLAQVVSCSVIANASPTGLALFDKVRPRIGGWFLFHEPKVFHGYEYSAHHRRHSERSRGIPRLHPGFVNGIPRLRCAALGMTGPVEVKLGFGA